MNIISSFLVPLGISISLSAYGQLPGGILMDKDSNSYHTVSIGSQLWMAENLKTGTYNDGTPIPEVMDNKAWTDLSTAAFCWYNNDPKKNKNLYGALYNWYAVSSGRLCPEGWHVPSENDWTVLSDFLLKTGAAAGQLKEESSAHWMYPNYGATNATGFTALPGGARHYSLGNFYVMGTFGNWWSSAAYDSNKALEFSITSGSDSLFRTYDNKKNGFSVRCVKDLKSGQPIRTDKDHGKWLVYVPPTGLEDILPPYDQWLPLMECYDSPACGIFTRDVDASKLYLYLAGVLPNGSYVTLFQLEHMVYINSETKEIIKKVW